MAVLLCWGILTANWERVVKNWKKVAYLLIVWHRIAFSSTDSAPPWHFHSLEGHSRGPFTTSCPLKEQPWGHINTNYAPEGHPLPHFFLHWMGISCFINYRGFQKGRRYDAGRGNWVYSKTHGLFVFLCTYIRGEMSNDVVCSCKAINKNVGRTALVFIRLYITRELTACRHEATFL